jgi:CHAD domain-containing protein
MPVHFRKAESPVRAVKRVARTHLDETLARLRRPSHPAAVHQARKEIKKLRAVFRLVQGEIKRRDYRKAGKALRQTGHRLAVPRDARVMLKAFEGLTGEAGGRRFPNLYRLLKTHYRRKSRAFQADDSVPATRKDLRKVDRRVKRLRIEPGGWKTYAPGLRRSYRLGWHACKEARKRPLPEHLHAWRKQVKTFWHQLRLLCPHWPVAVRKMMDRLEQLGELLGDEHDLSLLQKFLQEHGGGALPELKKLNELIKARQQALCAAALKLGGRLYAEPPAVICARLGRHWKSWYHD